MKSTNIIVIIAAFALISMPQMIGSANAQSEEASEHACPVPGYTLSKGECTAEPIINFECQPSVLGNKIVQRSGTICTVTTEPELLTKNECEDLGGQFSVSPKEKHPTVTCTFPATERITCPGDVPSTEEGECITKPGQGNDPT
jgi:hypothetical protein